MMTSGSGPAIGRGSAVATAALLVFFARAATASLPCTTGPEVQWTPAAGGNGHFYQVVCGPVSWDQANAAALASGRHLATLTSAEENAFVFSLIDDQGYWTFAGANYGPWVGGFQPDGSPEPAGGWRWVTPEPFVFTAWQGVEPNNVGDEDRILFYDGDLDGSRSPQWADVGGSFQTTYVVEWSHSLDADGDGEALPLTDGLLFLRRLFGFSGNTLTAGAVDVVNCTRCDAASIAAFIDLETAGRVYDVGDDWSDSANPNGPWSYREGTNLLPHVASWQSSLGGYTSAQPAWAKSENGTNRIPLFMKSLGFEDFAHDYVAGDIVTHTRDDANGIGNGEGHVIFTVPATGIYRVVASIWIGRDIGRSVDWTVSVDGGQLATGTVASGDGFSRAAPAGLEGSLLIEAGDEVDLLLARDSSFGDFAGFDLHLEAFGLDVDGDGETQPLSDGLLILRYLFGFTGTTLTAGVVDLAHCTRCDAAGIIEFFAELD